MKKNVFIISMLVILLCFTSCGINNSQKIIYNKTVENYGNTGGLSLPIDVNNTKIDFMLVSDIEELSDSLVVKELSKRTGLNVNIISVPSSVAARQTHLLLSTNELPDIMKTTLSESEIKSLGEKGTFAPVNKYLNELPNFRKIFIENEEYNSVMNICTAADSNLYYFPKFDFNKELTEGFLYRKDIFDKNGISMWETKEEFYQALRKLKEKYPDSTPYVSQSKSDIFSNWSLSFGIEFPGMYYNEEEGLWKYSGIDPRFFDMLEFMKKLYDERLIDSTFLTTSPYVWDWKITGENGFVTYGDLSAVNPGNDSLGGYNMEFANPPGDYFKIKKNKKTDAGPYVINNENSLLSMKLLDYLLSPSGIELSTLGVVNKTYEYTDNGVKYLDISESEISFKNLEKKYGLFIPELYRSVDKRSPVLKYTQKETRIINYIENKGGFKKEYQKTLEENEKKFAEETLNILDSKALEFATNYIFKGEKGDFSLWLLEAEKNGVYELEKIYNKQE